MNNKASKFVAIAIQRSCLFGFTPKQGYLNTCIQTTPYFNLSHFGNPFANSPLSFQRSNSYSTVIGFRCGPHVIKNLLSLFDQMLQRKPQPPIEHYNNLLNIMVKMDHHSHVILLFNKLSLFGCPMNDYTMSIVLNSYCRLKQASLGFGIIAAFLNRGYSPNIVSLTCLIKGLFLEQKVAEPEQLFRKIIKDKLCKVNEITTSIVLDGFCKSGNVGNAVHLLGDLEKATAKLSTSGYNTVIDGICKSRMVDDALAVLSRMIEIGFLPTVVTYTALIQGLCDFSRRDEAMKLFKQMVDDKVYPNVRTFNTLVDSYCKVVQIMKQFDVQPYEVTYNALMGGYCLHGQLDKAMEVLTLMADEGLKPDVVSYSTIINCYCKQKKLDQAWKMFKELPRKELFITKISEFKM